MSRQDTKITRENKAMNSSRPQDNQQQRRRTVYMHRRLEDEKQPVTSDGDKRYITINQIRYRILDGNVTDFNSERLISIGTYDREMIVLDPSSAYLKEKYKQLVKNIKQNRDIQTVLDLAIQFTRDQFEMDLPDDEVVQCLDIICKNKKRQLAVQNQSPVISLDIFLFERIGVCRHHGLILSYLLDNLIRNGILPPGHAYHHRINIENEGHVWAIYKPMLPLMHASREVYLVDSLWNTRAFNIRNYEAYLMGLGYGVDAIFECNSRYNVPDTYEPEFSDYFIQFLLHASAGDCRKFLNQQFQLKPIFLWVIQDELTRGNNHAQYQQNANYQDVLDDIVRVTETDFFHLDNRYSELKKADEQQQFVLGLLYKSEQDRNLVLNKQTINDLIQLKAALDHPSVDRKSLFETCPNYPALRTNVVDFLILKLDALCAKNYSEIVDADDRQTFVLSLLQKTPAERNAILNQQSDTDLKQIKATLNQLSDGSQPFQIVLQDIRQLEMQTALNIIQLIRKTILSNEFKIDITGPWVPNFHGKKIEIDGNAARIPKSFNKIYSMIEEVKLESASLETLDQLIKDIRASAEKSNKPYDYDNKKHDFLNKLRADTDRSSILRSLQSFYKKIAPNAMACDVNLTIKR